MAPRRLAQAQGQARAHVRELQIRLTAVSSHQGWFAWNRLKVHLHCILLKQAAMYLPIQAWSLADKPPQDEP